MSTLTPAAETWFAASVLAGCFVLMAVWTVRQVLRWSSEAVDRMVAEALGSLTADDLDDDWNQHVAEALALTETPIYEATAAHIAAQAAEAIDREWEQISTGRWGA